MNILEKIALTKIKGIGPKMGRMLLAYNGSVEEIFRSSKKQLLTIPNIGEYIVNNIVSKTYLKDAEQEYNFIQKHGISVDTPNLSLNLYLPLNEDTKNYFKRYSKFYLKGDETCWRVETMDWISTPGILEIAAVEYYSNEFEDDVENGVVDGLIEEIKDPNPKVEIGI